MPLVRACLFGSEARGAARPGSDLDVAVLPERDPTRRIQFEVDARNACFDMLPHLRRYRRGQEA